VVALLPMSRVASKPAQKDRPGPRRPPTRIYTAWHPLIVVLLSRVLPEGWYQLLSEVQLAREPLRVDIVIVRRSRPGALREHVEQLRHPLPGQRKRHMKDEEKVVASFQKAIEAMVKQLPPEEVLRVYAPEQRLAGLAPEQRLAGLSEEQAVLALPDAMLRALSDEYLATLPEATRAAITSRIGRG
jgi:hypothetical protein